MLLLYLFLDTLSISYFAISEPSISLSKNFYILLYLLLWRVQIKEINGSLATATLGAAAIRSGDLFY